MPRIITPSDYKLIKDVANQAARLAYYNAFPGCLVRQIDTNEVYVLKTNGQPEINSDWVLIGVLTSSAPAASDFLLGRAYTSGTGAVNFLFLPDNTEIVIPNNTLNDFLAYCAAWDGTEGCYFSKILTAKMISGTAAQAGTPVTQALIDWSYFGVGSFTHSVLSNGTVRFTANGYSGKNINWTVKVLQVKAPYNTV